MEKLKHSPTTIEPIDSTDSNSFLDQYEVLHPDDRAKKFRNRDFAAADTKQEVLEDYLTQFDRLVSKIRGTGQFEGAQPFDTVIFLDKSARPLSWMMSELWDEFAEPVPGDGGNLMVPPMPERKFLNIDRLTWRQEHDVEGDFHNITDADVAALRSIFDLNGHNLLDGESEAKPRRVLVVDELSESGDTQGVAKDLLERATHHTVVDTFAYMPSEKRDTAAGTSYEWASFPTWYPHKDAAGRHAEDGRGVLDPKIWNAQESLVNPRSANKFLSRPPEYTFSEKEISQIPLLKTELEAIDTTTPERARRVRELSARIGQLTLGFIHRDPKAEKLRRDMKRLARDFKASRLYPVISANRETIGGQPATEYYRLRRESLAKPRPLYSK